MYTSDNGQWQSFKCTEMLSSKSLVSSCGGSGSTMDNNRT